VLAMSAVLPWWKFSAQKRILGSTRKP